MVVVMPTNADKPHNCPHCNVSLLDQPIPAEHQHMYAGTYFKREIGVEFSHKYDGIWHFKCPDCGGTWGGYQQLLEQKD